jgi:hypothetical protein
MPLIEENLPGAGIPEHTRPATGASQAVEEEPSVSVASSNIPPQRQAVLQDTDYLQRILTPAFLNRPPSQHILVPQGPAGEEMEARLQLQSAARRQGAGHQADEEADQSRAAQLLQSFGRSVGGTQARSADSQPTSPNSR